jgi:ribokinase
MHIGAVGRDGTWALERLLEYGVETAHITVIDTPTGHANIHIDTSGENNIVLFPGANHMVTEQMIGVALAEASPGDFLLMQNETLGQLFAARTARLSAPSGRLSAQSRKIVRHSPAVIPSIR